MNKHTNFNFVEDLEILDLTRQMNDRFLNKDFLQIPKLANQIVDLIFAKEYYRNGTLTQNIEWHKNKYGKKLVTNALENIQKSYELIITLEGNNFDFVSSLSIMRFLSIFLQDVYLANPNYTFSETPYLNSIKTTEVQNLDAKNEASELDIKKTSLINLFKNRKYVFQIPFYQRDYTWKKTQLITLIEDIETRRKDDYTHYFGAITIKKDDLYNKKQVAIKIIDGQQRITTALLFLKAAYNNIANRELEPMPLLLELFENDFKWTDRYDNKSVREAKFKEFKTILEHRHIANGEWQYSKNYWYFYNTFDNFDSKKIHQYVLTFTTKFEIVQIEYDVLPHREMDIFENMNSKGTELEEWDLIKNQIFNLVEASDVDNNEKLKILENSFYYNFVAKIDKNKHASKLSDFFNEFIYFKIAGGDSEYKNFDRFIVYKNFKTHFSDKMTTKVAYKKMVNNFYAFGVVYKALLTKNPGLIDENLRKIESKWNSIASTKAVAFIIFKVVEKFGSWNGEKWIFENYENVFKFIDLFNIILIRLLVTKKMSQIPRDVGTEMVKRLDNFVKGDDNGITNYFKQILKIFTQINVSDYDFETRLIIGGINNKLAIKLLLQLNEYLDMKNNSAFKTSFKNLVIERVMPLKMDNWKGFLKEQSRYYIEEHKKHVDLLGNYYLLPQRLSPKVSKQVFERKRSELIFLNTPAIQGDEELKLTPLIDIAKWKFSVIEERNKAIVKILVKKIYNFEK